MLRFSNLMVVFVMGIVVFCSNSGHAQEIANSDSGLYSLSLPTSHGELHLKFDPQLELTMVTASLLEPATSYTATFVEINGIPWMALDFGSYGTMAYQLQGIGNEPVLYFSTVCDCAAVEDSALFKAITEALDGFQLASSHQQASDIVFILEAFVAWGSLIEDCTTNDVTPAGICDSTGQGGFRPSEEEGSNETPTSESSCACQAGSDPDGWGTLPNHIDETVDSSSSCSSECEDYYGEGTGSCWGLQGVDC